MLGACLLFVGIVLINNGICTLCKVDEVCCSDLPICLWPPINFLI